MIGAEARCTPPLRPALHAAVPTVQVIELADELFSTNPDDVDIVRSTTALMMSALDCINTGPLRVTKFIQIYFRPFIRVNNSTSAW